MQEGKELGPAAGAPVEKGGGRHLSEASQDSADPTEATPGTAESLQDALKDDREIVPEAAESSRAPAKPSGGDDTVGGEDDGRAAALRKARMQLATTGHIARSLSKRKHENTALVRHGGEQGSSKRGKLAGRQRPLQCSAPDVLGMLGNVVLSLQVGHGGHPRHAWFEVLAFWKPDLC